MTVSSNVIEGWKLAYDFFKHITTLDTGSVLLLLGIVEKLFKEPKSKHLVAVSIVLFLVSLAGCLMTMYLMSFLISQGGTPFGFPELLIAIPFVAAILCFLGGIVCIGVFTIKNYRA